jgi:putative SOS response-associated peptidase YedK
MIRSNFLPRYNIAPTQCSLVVRENGGRRELAELRWGLLPPWAKSAAAGARMINARAETVATSRAHRTVFEKRPCLVVADGFYEWKKFGPAEKQPYFITTKAKAPFAFAGLWEPKSIAPQDTFTILTCAPNELCVQVHDRMPVILAPEDWPKWLGTQAKRARLLRPFDAGRMDMWPVSKAVGSPRNDAPGLIEPVRRLG